MKRLILATAIGLAAASAAGAAPFGRASKGTTAAPFLKLSPGARPAAMGDALGGVADDLHAIHFNPAGLGLIGGVEGAAMHNSHFQGISHDFGAVAVPLLSWVDTRRQRNAIGVAAFSLTSLSVGGIPRRGVVETDEPTDTFGARDLAYTFAYGRALSGPFLAGGAFKVLDQRLDARTSRTVAVDGGVLFRGRRLSLGGGFRNFGGKVKFVSTADPLPFLLYGGAGLRVTERWLAAAELRLPVDDLPRLSIGGEYARPVSSGLKAALRGGYNMSNADADGFGGFTLGAGLEFTRLSFDFAWVPFGDLGNTFRYSVKAGF